MRKKKQFNQKANMLLLYSEIGKKANKLREGVKQELETLELQQYSTDLGKFSIVPTKSTSIDMNKFNNTIKRDKKYELGKLHEAGILIPSKQAFEAYVRSMGDKPSRYLITIPGTSRLDSTPIVKIPDQLYTRIFDIVYNLVVEELLKGVR
jgi:hypothetical protein